MARLQPVARRPFEERTLPPSEVLSSYASSFSSLLSLDSSADSTSSSVPASTSGMQIKAGPEAETAGSAARETTFACFAPPSSKEDTELAWDSELEEQHAEASTELDPRTSSDGTISSLGNTGPILDEGINNNTSSSSGPDYRDRATRGHCLRLVQPNIPATHPAIQRRSATALDFSSDEEENRSDPLSETSGNGGVEETAGDEASLPERSTAESYSRDSSSRVSDAEQSESCNASLDDYNDSDGAVAAAAAPQQSEGSVKTKDSADEAPNDVSASSNSLLRSLRTPRRPTQQRPTAASFVEPLLGLDTVAISSAPTRLRIPAALSEEPFGLAIQRLRNARVNRWAQLDTLPLSQFDNPDVVAAAESLRQYAFDDLNSILDFLISLWESLVERAEESERLQNQVTSYEIQRRALESELRTLKSKAAASEAQWQHKLTNVLEEIDETEQMLLASSETARKQKRKDIHRIPTGEPIRDELADQAKMVDDLKTERATLKRNLADAASQIANLTKNIQELEASAPELDILRAKLQAISQNLHDAESENRRLAVELHTSRAEVQLLQEELSKSRTALEELNSLLESSSQPAELKQSLGHCLFSQLPHPDVVQTSPGENQGTATVTGRQLTATLPSNALVDKPKVLPRQEFRIIPQANLSFPSSSVDFMAVKAGKIEILSPARTPCSIVSTNYIELTPRDNKSSNVDPSSNVLVTTSPLKSSKNESNSIHIHLHHHVHNHIHSHSHKHDHHHAVPSLDDSAAWSTAFPSSPVSEGSVPSQVSLLMEGSPRHLKHISNSVKTNEVTPTTDFIVPIWASIAAATPMKGSDPTARRAPHRKMTTDPKHEHTEFSESRGPPGLSNPTISGVSATCSTSKLRAHYHVQESN